MCFQSSVAGLAAQPAFNFIVASLCLRTTQKRQPTGTVPFGHAADDNGQQNLS